MAAIRLTSPLSPVQLAEAIKAALPAEMGAGSPEQVTGYGTEARMTLWAHRPNFRNSFRQMLTARVEPAAAGAGSVISGTIGMHFATRLFLWFWMGLVVVFGGGGGLVALAVGMPLSMTAIALAIPIAMLAMVALLLAIGRRTAREDEARIVAFLRDTVAAERVRV